MKWIAPHPDPRPVSRHVTRVANRHARVFVSFGARPPERGQAEPPPPGDPADIQDRVNLKFPGHVRNPDSPTLHRSGGPQPPSPPTSPRSCPRSCRRSCRRRSMLPPPPPPPPPPPRPSASPPPRPSASPPPPRPSASPPPPPRTLAFTVATDAASRPPSSALAFAAATHLRNSYLKSHSSRSPHPAWQRWRSPEGSRA